ncbi:MAG: YfiR family protein [Bdellovibrionota bacterium]
MAVLALLLFPPVSVAEEAVPIATQVPILFKLFSMDKNLSRHGGSEFSFALFFDSKNGESRRQREEFERTLGGGRKVGGLLIAFRAYDVSEGMDFEKVLQESAGLYAAAGIERHLDKILSASRARSVTAASGSASLAEKGFAIGFEIDQGRPRIVINLPAAKAQGCDFSADVLKLARVIR